MFWKREKTADIIKKAAQDLATIRANDAGATRRATGFMPVAANGSTREVAQTSSLRFHQLLISLEGNQRTGCLRILSPKHKARAAILIYKGRVVGCLYGSRKLDFQCLQHDAHRLALAELAAPGNVLDAYELPEELVLAAASLFNGEVLDTNVGGDASTCFEQTFRAIANSQLPGCIVISNANAEMICMAYIYAGKIIGVFSATDGWISPSFESVQKYVKQNMSLHISASFLPLPENKQPANLGFSLTGLGDSNQRPAVQQPQQQQQQLQAVNSFAAIANETSSYSSSEPVYQRHTPAPAFKPSVEISPPVRSHNVFAIAP